MTIASEISSLVSSMLEPTPLVILFSVILVVTLPALLHLVLTSSTTSHTLPTILLLGPSGSGKTSILTHFETGRAAATRPTQSPLTVECSLPVSTKTSNPNQYRSPNDPTATTHQKFLLADTPGHAKLRRVAISALTTAASGSSGNNSNLRGILFAVDATDLSTDSDYLRQTAEYLHDVLLLLTKRAERASSSSSALKSRISAGVGIRRGGPATRIKLLIAATKTDLFTALPARLVKDTLEREIGRVRESLQKGLLESGVAEGEVLEKGWLGEAGKEFRFEDLGEEGEEGSGGSGPISVSVRAGSVVGKGDVGDWWEWVGECI